MNKSLKNKLDKLFSIYIRLRGSDENEIAECVTCGKKDHWKKMQCGHFQSRRHNSTRWDEKNANVQCYGCNVCKQGEQYIHGKFIDSLYGKGTSEDLLIKSLKIEKINDADARDRIEEIAERIREQEARLNIRVL